MSLALLWLLGCAPDRCQTNGTTLGTTWQLTWTGASCDPSVGAAVADVLKRVDAELGARSQGTERAILRESTGRTEVKESTYALLRVALDVASASDGAFDPTIGPVTQAWGFHTDAPSTPTEAVLAEAVAQVGWSRVELGRGEGRAPWIDRHDTTLDLSGLIEGHAADRVADRLVLTGIGNFVVTVGDEVRVGGSGPAGLWKVGLDVEPGDPGSDLVLRLAGGGMASAGAAAVEIDGQTVPKTLDPGTGKPVETDVSRAVVLAPTATEADALATAWVTLGSTRGLELIEARAGVEGLVYVEGKAEPVESSGVGVLVER